MTRRRNPLGHLPILAKGGVHERSKSGQRARLKRSLDAAIDQWREDVDDELSSTKLDGSAVEPFQRGLVGTFSKSSLRTVLSSFVAIDIHYSFCNPPLP